MCNRFMDFITMTFLLVLLSTMVQSNTLQPDFDTTVSGLEEFLKKLEQKGEGVEENGITVGKNTVQSANDMKDSFDATGEYVWVMNLNKYVPKDEYMSNNYTSAGPLGEHSFQEPVKGSNQEPVKGSNEEPMDSGQAQQCSTNYCIYVVMLASTAYYYHCTNKLH